ncbi:unnamed protein product [Ectocarpus sp. 6 AP-2014]
MMLENRIELIFGSVLLLVEGSKCALRQDSTTSTPGNADISQGNHTCHTHSEGVRSCQLPSFGFPKPASRLPITRTVYGMGKKLKAGRPPPRKNEIVGPFIPRAV